jgi:ABC-type Zn uptake system ZnuABC Zn-binding protein ZnuA
VIRRVSPIASLAVAAVILMAACSAATGTPAPSDGRIRVLATTTVFADLARNAGGGAVVVDSLVPRGADPHTFAPRPSDLRKVADADVIIMNGLGVDDWLTPLLASAKRADTSVVVLGTDLPGATYLASGATAGPGGAAPATGAVNPHLWLNVAYAEEYVRRISAALKAARPSDAQAIDASTTAYVAQLQALDASIRSRIAAIPVANRRIVSFHDAFPYYAAAYGLEIVGVAVEAPGQDPSASQVATLIDAIRANGVKAVFSEAQFNPKVIDQIAQEAGAKVVATLYNDSLGDPPVDTYVGMMQWDTDQVVGALQ